MSVDFRRRSNRLSWVKYLASALSLLALAACAETPPPQGVLPPPAAARAQESPAASPLASGFVPVPGPAAPGSPQAKGDDSVNVEPEETVDSPGTAQGTAVAAVPAPSGPKPNCGCGPADLLCLMSCSGGKSVKTPPPPEDRPFDRGAVSEALVTAAKAAKACATPAGPRGAGKVLVTFAPTGLPVSAVVETPPFGGTPVGACLAAVFRRVRVPSFTGGTVRVSKSFYLE